jgi:hypothetical protein
VSNYNDTTKDGDDNKHNIPVVLKTGEDDTGNTFIGGNNGLISGTVKDDKGELLPGVTTTRHSPEAQCRWSRPPAPPPPPRMLSLCFPRLSQAHTKSRRRTF